MWRNNRPDALVTEERTPITEQRFAELVRYANSFALKRPNLEILRRDAGYEHTALSDVLQEAIKSSDRRFKLVLPDLRVYENETVVVLTDYSGEHAGSKYATYSTLLCPWSCCRGFQIQMERVRQKHGLGTKEIEFKDFGMGQLQRALPGYLELLDMMPGFLFTLVVDTRIKSLFEVPDASPDARVSDVLEVHGFGRRKPKIAEKLMRIVDTAAFLTALLAHDGQRIFWMTDNDSIVEAQDSSQGHESVLELFQTMLLKYKRPEVDFKMIGGAAPFADDNTMFGDLLSAPDVVAGALWQYMTQKRISPEGRERVKTGCDQVLEWLTKDGIGLKKMTIAIQQDLGGPQGAFKSSIIELSMKDIPEDALMIPVFV